MKKQTSKPVQGVWMLSVVIAAVLTLGYLAGGFGFDGSQITLVPG